MRPYCAHACGWFLDPKPQKRLSLREWGLWLAPEPEEYWNPKGELAARALGTLSMVAVVCCNTVAV